MSLVLEIEYLLGAAFAAKEPDNPLPDWPPQPDRVFSALVASWGAGGECEEERCALEWLEALPTPAVAAGGGFARTAPTVFVPPNDPESGRVGNAAVLPSWRRRQARRFPAFRPENPVISMIWQQADADPDRLAALNRLAADTAYIGHSASLTRCRFHNGEPTRAGRPARVGVYRGRLAEMRRDFQAQPPRRPRPGNPVRQDKDQKQQSVTGTFSREWLVLEHVGGDMPDIRAAALLAKRLRDTIMSGYARTGQADSVPAVISGHSPDGAPSPDPHLAIAPLAFVGRPHASGSVYGFALIPPRGNNLLADPDFQKAFRAVGHPEGEKPRVITVRDDGFEVKLAPASADAPRSLDPARYLAAATRWSSCTPLVLDRHLKEAGNEAREREIEQLIKRACANVGLPEPIGVRAAKHSAFEGAAPAYPSGGAPRWLRWRLPPSLASRQLTHITIEFREPVSGPVLLGAGRFVGLGLCLPLNTARRQ